MERAITAPFTYYGIGFNFILHIFHGFPSDSIAEGYSEEEDDDGDLIIENDNVLSYNPNGLHSSNNGNYSRDSLGRLGSTASMAPLAHSASMPSSFVTSQSDSSMTTLNQNGSPAHTASSSSQESMREDGNIITL